jgi:hypothetical protein
MQNQDEAQEYNQQFSKSLGNKFDQEGEENIS